MKRKQTSRTTVVLAIALAMFGAPRMDAQTGETQEIQGKLGYSSSGETKFLALTVETPFVGKNYDGENVEVTTLQIVGDALVTNTWKRLVGKEVVLVGRPTCQETVHHFTPILSNPDKIREATAMPMPTEPGAETPVPPKPAPRPEEPSPEPTEPEEAPKGTPKPTSVEW